MLYQKNNTGTPRVVRYGSKGLSKWQRSYGPTKLELLGMFTSVLDCASYIRGRHFVLNASIGALVKSFFNKSKLVFGIPREFHSFPSKTR
jgi:hypothetical protein